MIDKKTINGIDLMDTLKVDDKVIEEVKQEFSDNSIKQKSLQEAKYSSINEQLLLKQINNIDENNIIKERMINEKTNYLLKLLSANKSLKSSILTCVDDKNKKT